MQHKPFIITIVGPESSGKTTLARELASRYGAPWVPEYARKYLKGLGRPYRENDLIQIAEGQLKTLADILEGQFSVGSSQWAVFSGLVDYIPASRKPPSPYTVLPPDPLKGVNSEERTQYSFLTFQKEEFGEEPRPLVIVDSGMLSLRIWARLKYGIAIPVVEDALKEDNTSLYMLTRPVLEWQADPLREAPALLDRVWIYNQYLKELSGVRQR